jgi:hypothetical protein
MPATCGWLSEHLGLALKPDETFRVAGKDVRDDFECDVALGPRVACAIHLADATRPSSERTSFEPIDVPGPTMSGRDCGRLYPLDNDAITGRASHLRLA